MSTTSLHGAAERNEAAALRVAAHGNRFEAAGALIEAGADANLADGNGGTPGQERRRVIMPEESRFLCEAIALARANIDKGGRPFGAVLVRDGEVVAAAANEMHVTGDPTSHAEMNAIRAASRKLGSPDLGGSAVYASGHPCPMCLAAMRISGVSKVFYAYSNEDGAPFGLSTAAIYDELARPFSAQSMTIRHMPVRPEGETDLYAAWTQAQGKLRQGGPK